MQLQALGTHASGQRGTTDAESATLMSEDDANVMPSRQVPQRRSDKQKPHHKQVAVYHLNSKVGHVCES